MPERRADPQALTNVQSNVIFECVQLRERAGLTQRALAERLGIPHIYIGRWEKGAWLKTADQVIAGYAALAPRTDAGTIWRRAVSSWGAPVPGSPKHVIHASEAVLRTRRGR